MLLRMSVISVIFLAAQPILADQHDVYQLPVVTEEMKETELRELGEARTAARNHAQSCENCVGIVFSIGDDIRSDVFRETVAYLEREGFPVTENNMMLIGEQITELYVQHYEQRYTDLFETVGINMKMFSRVDYGTDTISVGSGLNFHIGRTFFHDFEDNDRTRFFANDVDAEMVVEVAEQLSVVWEIDPDLRAQE